MNNRLLKIVTHVVAFTGGILTGVIIVLMAITEMIK